MILSLQDLLSDNQAITTTAASTNSLDLGATGTVYGTTAAIVRDIGKGEPEVDLLVQATAAFTAVGAATLTITLQTDDNSAFSSATDALVLGPFPKATLVAGWKLPVQYMPESINERYFRLNYTVATGPMTAGNLTAGVVMGRQTNG
jgi:hypothetical protein